MSYDVYAHMDAGGDEPISAEPWFDDVHPAFRSDGMAGTAVMTATGYARCGNYTSNVSPIWSKCLTAVIEAVPDAKSWAGDDARGWNVRRPDHPYEIDTERLRLADLAGKRMGDIALVLHEAVEWGVDHIEELREMNPNNGWGNAEGAITYLWDIARFCDQYPNANLYISR